MNIATTHYSAAAVTNDNDRLSIKQEVKVIWQKAPHGGPIPRLGVTQGSKFVPLIGVGFPISVP